MEDVDRFVRKINKVILKMKRERGRERRGRGEGRERERSLCLLRDVVSEEEGWREREREFSWT